MKSHSEWLWSFEAVVHRSRWLASDRSSSILQTKFGIEKKEIVLFWERKHQIDKLQLEFQVKTQDVDGDICSVQFYG